MKTAAKGKEKRHFQRVSAACNLRYLRIPKKTAEYRNAMVQDISPGGFRFRTGELFKCRSCFLLDLFVPGSTPIRSLATVAWIKTLPEDDGYQIGGKFVEPNPDVEAALAHLASED
jgi:hypothetical protein